LNWQGKRVLVTGAGGFIGSHLAERLCGLGARVRAFVHYNGAGSFGWLDESPTRDSLDIIAGDVCDGEFVRQAVDGCTIVFHLAALIGIPYSYRAVHSYVQVNVQGTLNILQACRSIGIERMVHTSTSEVYGTANYVPIDEAHPLQAQSPYSASKIAADKLAEAFHHSFEVPVVTVRPFNTFGPRQSARAVIPTIVTQALSQERIALGSLKPTRDLNYVADTVDGFVRAAETDAGVGQVVNLGSGQEISIGQLASTILEILNKKMPIVSEETRVRPQASEVERLCSDNRKALRLFSWKPQYSLIDGLRPTVAWLEKNLERYRPTSYVV
jgi:NAD dependent epimerase/dehydratase